MDRVVFTAQPIGLEMAGASVDQALHRPNVRLRIGHWCLFSTASDTPDYVESGPSRRRPKLATFR